MKVNCVEVKVPDEFKNKLKACLVTNLTFMCGHAGDEGNTISDYDVYRKVMDDEIINSDIFSKLCPSKALVVPVVVHITLKSFRFLLDGKEIISNDSFENYSYVLHDLS